MSIPYCLPIIKSSTAEILEIIQANLADYQYFEVWLDYVDKLDEAFITRLTELLGERLIILFRRQNLEPIHMELAQRQTILKRLHNTPVLVDLDITMQRAELDYIREQQLVIRTIVSYHDYHRTPDQVQLKAIIATMESYQPAIYKLATLCEVAGDGLRLMELLLEFKQRGLMVIVSGMGQHGQIVKVFGGLWGNAMTFAPQTAAEQSAPGQLTRQQLEIIFKQLES